MYSPTRPQLKAPRYAIVASINARWDDWAGLSDAEYEIEKNWLIEQSVRALEKLIPDIRGKLDHLEAATPRTVHHYTRHVGGTSFGTKFEGLKVSQHLPDDVLPKFRKFFAPKALARDHELRSHRGQQS